MLKAYRFPLALFALGSALTGTLHAQVATEKVVPSTADPRVHDFDFPNIVLNGQPATRGAPLVVFMPGTGGGKQGGPHLLLETIAHLGYRVIFLAYDNEPAGNQICPQRPPQCAGLFRESRVFGGTEGPVPTAPAEAIVPRLTALLRYLDKTHPDAGWSDYLAPEGNPAWSRIVVSGLSQGAGMAAYIAKRSQVRRVVLFSSPWDDFGPRKLPAPWLAAPSATPPARWWAERHARENTTQLIAQAYEVLGIPRDHLLIFDGELTGPSTGENPYHGSTVSSPAYLPQWQTMFGHANSPGASD